MKLIALRSNVPSSEGSPRETLGRALAALEEKGVIVRTRSRAHLVEPPPGSSEPRSVHQVAAVETVLSPSALLALLRVTEASFGRKRDRSDAPEVLGIDLVAYDEAVLETGDLILPFPGIRRSASLLAPLAEVAPGWHHPATGEPIGKLLADVDRSCLWALRPTPRLMGIVNATPDSFSDGGRFAAIDSAIAHALSLIDDGADIVDIGGESTRPGADPVPPAVEQARILPVIRAVAGEARRRLRLVSVDSRNAETMSAAIEAGATMVNDVSALSDPSAVGVVAGARLPVVIMHMQGEPKTMQDSPHYADVVAEVASFLAAARDRAVAGGIAAEKIWLDPGIGFGKTVLHNFELMRSVPSLKALGHPVLVGASRKGFGSRIDRACPASERLGSSLASALSAAGLGADMLRVHDVAETRQALALWSALEGDPSA
jgi:dihydropteroate synthase/2-amino-4-hydroxy-6-hydroxymethyldihydropteridine diphosphokinase